ncbi:MAG: adenosylcobinamide-GDP ribazoletransferase [Tissierellales bacterium]|jgi:adenosylcobinamide-GDP ribazoletransferase|nr:adenosylcobinamide-GDP ribazoletransferase [Tissierellales bacterium]
MKSLVMMVTFLTRIPLPQIGEFNEKDFVRGILYAPIIGLLIGSVLAIESYLLRPYLPSIVLGFLIFLTYLVITGGLHIDGLVDSADGLYSSRKKEKILEIMKDSRVGTFGALALLIVCIGFIIGAGYLGWQGILFVPLVGRITLLQTAASGKYARSEGGMGKGIVDYVDMKHWMYWVLIFGAIALVGAILIDKILFAIIFLSYIQLIGIMHFKLRDIIKKIDGITGDIMGYSVEISQVLYMMILIIWMGVFGWSLYL